MENNKSNILATLIEIAKENIAAYRAGDSDKMSGGCDELFQRFGKEPESLFLEYPDLKILHDFIDVFVDSATHNFPDMGIISVERGCQLLESVINKLSQNNLKALADLKENS